MSLPGFAFVTPFVLWQGEKGWWFGILNVSRAERNNNYTHM